MTNSVEQYDRRNNIEINEVSGNIEDKNLEHSVIEIFKAVDIQTSHNNVKDCHRIGTSKDNSKKTIVRLVIENIASRSYITRGNSKVSMDQELVCQIPKYL